MLRGIVSTIAQNAALFDLPQTILILLVVAPKGMRAPICRAEPRGTLQSSIALAVDCGRITPLGSWLL
jgi:hypothetical protein